MDVDLGRVESRPRHFALTLEKADDRFWDWFAGFWEGEGSFTVFGRKACFAVYQKNPIPLQYIKSMIGGAVYTDRHPENAWPDDYYQWQQAGIFNAIALAQALLPHLHFRKVEVETKLDIVRSWLKAGVGSWSRWTEKEHEFAVTNLEKLSSRQIDKLLGRGMGCTKAYLRAIAKRSE